MVFVEIFLNFFLKVLDLMTFNSLLETIKHNKTSKWCCIIPELSERFKAFQKYTLKLKLVFWFKLSALLFI